MCVCMSVRNVCMHVCMYVMYVCMYVCMYVMYVCMYGCMCGYGMYECMYACMYECMYTSINKYLCVLVFEDFQKTCSLLRPVQY